MKFIELSPQYKNDWDRIALNSDDTWMFHLYDWLPFTDSVWGLESKSFLLEHQGKFIGIFPLQLNKRSRSLRSLYMSAGGVGLINGLEEGLRKKAFRLMHEHAREIAVLNESPFFEIRISPLSPCCLKNERNVIGRAHV